MYFIFFVDFRNRDVSKWELYREPDKPYCVTLKCNMNAISETLVFHVYDRWIIVI